MRWQARSATAASASLASSALAASWQPPPHCGAQTSCRTGRAHYCPASAAMLKMAVAQKAIDVSCKALLGDPRCRGYFEWSIAAKARLYSL